MEYVLNSVPRNMQHIFTAKITCINDSHFLLLLTATVISLKGVHKLNHRVQLYINNFSAVCYNFYTT